MWLWIFNYVLFWIKALKLGVRDQWRLGGGGGWGLLPLIFSPVLARKLSGFARTLLVFVFLPENGHLNNSSGGGGGVGVEPTNVVISHKCSKNASHKCSNSWSNFSHKCSNSWSNFIHLISANVGLELWCDNVYSITPTNVVTPSHKCGNFPQM